MDESKGADTLRAAIAGDRRPRRLNGEQVDELHTLFSVK